MIYMIFRMFSMNKGVNRRRKIISVVNQIPDEQAFYAAADELLRTEEDPVIQAKTRVIRLWGMIYHDNTDHFEDELNEIDLEPLFTEKRGQITIEPDEDSFFYLLLSTPNMLYGLDRLDLIEKIFDKASAYDDKLNNQLLKAVADHCRLFYEGKEDLGEAFFRKIDEGDYPGYKYSRQLIGVYKNICDTMLCKILSDRGEDYSEFEIYAQTFAKMGIGKRWVSVLGLELKSEDENTEDVKEIEYNEEPEDEAEIIEAVIEEDETAEDMIPEEVPEEITEETEPENTDTEEDSREEEE